MLSFFWGWHKKHRFLPDSAPIPNFQKKKNFIVSVGRFQIMTYPSSHDRGSVKNGCTSNRIVTFQIVRHFPLGRKSTLPETNSSHLKIGLNAPKGDLILQPLIFKGKNATLVSGRVHQHKLFHLPRLMFTFPG